MTKQPGQVFRTCRAYRQAVLAAQRVKPMLAEAHSENKIAVGLSCGRDTAKNDPLSHLKWRTHPFRVLTTGSVSGL